MVLISNPQIYELPATLRGPLSRILELDVNHHHRPLSTRASSRASVEQPRQQTISLYPIPLPITLAAMPETTAQHNGTVRSTVSDTASGMYNRAQRSLDYVVPPSSRQQAYDNTAAFASERPVLFVRFYLSILPILFHNFLQIPIVYVYC